MQNQSKDVERAIMEFSRVQEEQCIGFETAAELSEYLREALSEDVIAGPAEDAVKILEDWTDADRGEFVNKLNAYRRLRTSGLNHGSANHMLPLAKAEELWKLLRTHHPSDVAEVRKQGPVRDKSMGMLLVTMRAIEGVDSNASQSTVEALDCFKGVRGGTVNNLGYPVSDILEVSKSAPPLHKAMC